MSYWFRPDIESLERVIRSSAGSLVLCSPFIRRDVLEKIDAVIPDSVEQIEVWTKLSFRDWLVGASEPDGLLEFVARDWAHDLPVSVFHGERLHAKVIVSDGPEALAGSANLTRGGFVRNEELMRIVDGREVNQLKQVALGIRSELVQVSEPELRQFVTSCMNSVETQEALLDLIREELPVDDAMLTHRGSLLSYSRFWEHLENSPSPIAREVLHIAKNRDRNNNTGKVKQAFFGIQRFLQEYPVHQEYVGELDDRQWFDVRESHLLDDWIEFLQLFEDEIDSDHHYSIRTLRGYLPESSGGRLTGGGGGVSQLQRVWPFVGRMMQEYQSE